MKNVCFTISLLMFYFVGLAQVPEGIRYQTIVRYTDGQPVPSTSLALQATIRMGTADGQAVYVETHNLVTNEWGLVNIIIGTGNAGNWNFADIQWELTAYFLETAIDLSGSGDFQTMGTTQFLSVPYSLHSGKAGGVPAMTTDQRDQIGHPKAGMRIFNTSTNCLNYYSGTTWLEVCKDCIPPNQANAGPDQTLITSLTTTLQGNEPQNAVGTWSIVQGIGGNFANVHNPETAFYGTSGENYTLKWTIHNDCGTTSDEVIIGFANLSLNCEQQLIDERDGQIYPTVLIANQCWMAKNLNVGTKLNSSAGSTNNNEIEKYCYNNLSILCNEYGGLYRWDEMMDYSSTPGTQGICPDGWHTPQQTEWTVLIDHLGGETMAGGNLKESGIARWNFPNTGATNSSGFTALPGGRMQNSGTFEKLGSEACLWTSSQTSTENADFKKLTSTSSNIYSENVNKSYGLSVRCIKNGSASGQLEVTPGHHNVSYEAGSVVFEVSANISWIVQKSAAWFSVSTLYGSNDGSFTVYYDENTSSQTRSGEITISAENGNPSVSVTVTQVGFSIFCGVDFLDSRNGEIYPTVLINNQCWMAKNLNIGSVTNYIDNQSNNGIIEKYCHDNDNDNCDIYGGLYQWDEMMNYTTLEPNQGICPAGWHVPTDSEWLTLVNFLGGTDIAGGKLKEAGFEHWFEPNTAATNSSGFTALPSSLRSEQGNVGVYGYDGHYWSSTQLYQPQFVYYYYLYYTHGLLGRYSENKANGMAVRCLKNNL